MSIISQLKDAGYKWRGGLLVGLSHFVVMLGYALFMGLALKPTIGLLIISSMSGFSADAAGFFRHFTAGNIPGENIPGVVTPEEK